MDPRDPSAEQRVADAIGRMMAFWGFRRNLGRIWALLYLAPAPVAAAELVERLRLSTGAVSMALSELQRWGAVRKVFLPGDRRDFYEAEEDIWSCVTRVVEQREAREIDQALAALATAERQLDAEAAAGAPAEVVAFRRRRIAELEDLAAAGRDLLRLVLGQESVAELLARTAGEPEAPRLDVSSPGAAPVRIPRAPED